MGAYAALPALEGRLAVVPRFFTLTAVANHLLDALPGDVRHALGEALERVHLPVKSIVYESGGRMNDVYFPIDAVISIVTVMRDGTHIEVVTVGREGLTGAQGLLDGPVATQLTYCQVAGEAYRLPFARFAELCERFPALRALVQGYLSALLDVMAQSIACNRLHAVNERCARWLLMTYDRIGRTEFPLTHEVLATMLGVRRAGVSIAAAALQHAGSISYRRGRFSVVDRFALEGAACECYTAINAAFARRRPAP
ncbi:MAG TPA: Crp/Fnr family transcriptional regulator [Candidatus Elarobacter sp.]|nr:Crp/Fnr family transcriptional regulator [Candidatus Elarobacter sp.]HEV2739522.1 Crp/Fnr family transcriptional regulator [Candidatus Elarobacter sp.]